MLTDFLQTVINFLADLGASLFDKLPDSPFLLLDELTVSNQMLSWIAWIIPFPQIIALLEAWVACVLGWHVLQWGFRFTKFIK